MGGTRLPLGHYVLHSLYIILSFCSQWLPERDVLYQVVLKSTRMSHIVRGAVFSITILFCEQALADSGQTRSISVPAHLFLAELNKRRVLPTLRVYYRDSGWRFVDAADVNSGCGLSLQGVLTVANRKNGEFIERCEFVLFSPDFELAEGWELVRIHWGGATRSVRWIANPFQTNIPRLHLQLTAPKKGNRSVIMRLLTLKGPVGSTWEESLVRP